MFKLLLFFLVVIFLTVLNAVAGCCAAIYLGYGPPSVKDAIVLLGLEGPVQRLAPFAERGISLVNGLKERFKRKKSTEEEVPAEEPVPEETQKPVLDMEEMLKSVSESNLNDLLDDEADEIEMVAPLQELFDDDLTSALMEKGTEAWLMGEKHVETSILKLNVVMMKSGKFSAELDQRLRNALGSVGESFARQCMDELMDDCKNYLQVQASVTEQIQKRIDEFGELSYLAEEIDYANMEQSAQIETTISNIEHLDPKKSEETAQKLIKELSKLRLARHRLRDQQEKAFLSVTRYEDRMETIAQQLFIDETNGLRNRIGLEVTLWDWWRQKRQEKRKICFGLLDFVKFGEINDEHGIVTADKVIKYLGHFLEKEFTTQDLTGMYVGNCFMVVSVNMGLRKTVSEIEKIRQSLERTTFSYGNGAHEFSVNLTCAVAEALPNLSDEETMKIVEGVLKTAKKAGRNHSFFLDQEALNPEAELVTPPNLGAEYITIDLDTQL